MHVYAQLLLCVCSIHISRFTATVTCTNTAFRVFLPWKQGKSWREPTPSDHPRKIKGWQRSLKGLKALSKRGPCCERWGCWYPVGCGAGFVEGFLSPSLLPGMNTLSLLPFRHSKQNICVETAATSSLLLPHKRHWGKNKAVFYWHSLGLASPCVGATLSFMTAVGWHKCSHRTGMSSVQDWCSCPLTPDADAEPSGRCHTCTPVPKVGKKISMGRERWTVAVVYSRLPWGEGGCWGPGAISMPHSAPQLRLSTKPGDEGASLWTSEINQPWNIPMLIAPLRDSIQRNTALLCFITWGACAARWLFINF